MTSSLPVWLPFYKSFFLSSILCFPLIQMCLTQVTFSHPPQGFLHCFLNKATCLTDLPTLFSEHFFQIGQDLVGRGFGERLRGRDAPQPSPQRASSGLVHGHARAPTPQCS